DVLILSGDQLYRMDFAELVRTHRENKADVTIAVHPVPRSQAPRFGVVRLDNKKRIVDLVEKPQTEAQLDSMKLTPGWLEKHGVISHGREFLANMGIYLFNRKVLFDLLHSQPLAKDLVTELFARRLSTHPLQA